MNIFIGTPSADVLAPTLVMHSFLLFCEIIIPETFSGTFKLAINNETWRLILLLVKLYPGYLLKIKVCEYI